MTRRKREANQEYQDGRERSAQGTQKMNEEKLIGPCPSTVLLAPADAGTSSSVRLANNSTARIAIETPGSQRSTRSPISTRSPCGLCVSLAVQFFPSWRNANGWGRGRMLVTATLG